MEINETIKCQLAHRSIREFTDEPVSDEMMGQLLEVANQTATSMGMQNTSIIWVKDPEKRRQLAAINGQEYVARAPIYLLWIVDLARPAAIFAEHGLSDVGVRTMDLFTSAFTDACLQVQNVTVAAESLGLGTTILGGVLNNPPAVIELLDLPELTFPALALMLGHPAQDPMLKPRMAKELRVMVDGYRRPENWTEALKDYDAQMHTYYDLRHADKPLAAFTQQLINNYAAPHPARAGIMENIKAQGFDPALGV